MRENTGSQIVKLGLTASVCLLAFAVSGCDSSGEASSKPDGSAATSASSQAESSSYQVVLDGAPLTFRRVFAYSHGEGALRLVFSDKVKSCEQLRKSKAGGVHFSITGGDDKDAHELTMTLAPTFAADGKRPWKLSDVRMDDKPSGSFSKKVPLEMKKGDPTKTVIFSLSEPVVMKASSVFERPADQTIEFPKEVRAEGCGAILAKADPTAQPQPALSLKVNGTPFQIRSATLVENDAKFRTFGQYTLRLASAPTGCSRRGEADLEVSLGFDPGNVHPRHIAISGLLTFNGNLQTSQESSLSKLTVATEDMIGGKPFALDGALDDLFGMKMEMAGTLQAKRCEK